MAQGLGLQGAYGVDEMQKFVRQRILDRILEEERQRKAKMDEREMLLREAEAKQRADYQNEMLRQLGESRDAQADARRQGIADKVEGSLDIGQRTQPEQSQALRGALRGNLLKPQPATPGGNLIESLSPDLSSGKSTMQPPMPAGDTYLGNPQQRNAAERQRIIGRLVAGMPENDLRRTALEAENAPGGGVKIPPGFIPTKPESVPVIRVNPRTGTLENLGEAPQGSHFATEPAPRDTSAQDSARTDRSYQFHRNILDRAAKPLEEQQQRMGRLIETLNQGTPQADALVAPELLTVMAGGMGSGLRMNEAEIARIIGGRSKWESLRAAMQKWSIDPKSANSITPEQRAQVRALVQAVHEKSVRATQALDAAGDQLVEADVNGHRRIVAEAKKKVRSIYEEAGKEPAPTPKQAGRRYDLNGNLIKE